MKKVENKKEPVGYQDCDYPIRDCCNDTPCIYFTERLPAGLFHYAGIIENYFNNCELIRLNRRLDFLVRNFDGEIFLNPIHRFRFYTVCQLQDISIEDRNPAYLDSCDFKKIHQNGMNADGYAIFQTARTIYTSREYIRQDEIAVYGHSVSNQQARMSRQFYVI